MYDYEVTWFLGRPVRYRYIILLIFIHHDNGNRLGNMVLKFHLKFYYFKNACLEQR